MKKQIFLKSLRRSITIGTTCLDQRLLKELFHQDFKNTSTLTL